MSKRVPWDKIEIALLFRAYEKVSEGSDINLVAVSLSETLRNLARHRGIEIDNTFRNVNGMKMQLGNVQYMFTDGAKGLSGASSLIREMYHIYLYDQEGYQKILKEAIQMTGEFLSVEESFYEYAKGKTNLSPKALVEYLKKATDYCNLKQPLLGMTDVMAVRDIQKKIAEGKLLSFQFGKDAQIIRSVTQLYYSFVKKYRKPKDVVRMSKADRWQPILIESFPDGYILDDFLSQFQAAAFWQERYGEACPLKGSAIDGAMKAIGNVRDGRVYVKKEGDNNLIIEICSLINDILSRYSCVYRSSVYNRFQSELAACAIYTESVMTQQLLENSKCNFCSKNQVFVHPGKEPSIAEDCKMVLRDYGGAMTVGDIAKELWFVPYNLVYHNLSIDSETLNVGSSTWMLVEHFPLTKEDADTIGDVLDECFISQNFVKQTEIIPFVEKYLPSVAENLSGLHFTAVFNILNYYLKERFSFSKAIISPKGFKTDFRELFKSYAKEHERFTLDELAAFASDMNVSIYWESTFNAGAVRISKIDFVNRKFIAFDVDSIDTVLESICTGDYLPLAAISNAMLMHLPTCGYCWNGYLLLSYLYSFSKVFRLCYKSIGKSGYYGAMVKNRCKSIDSYEKLVEQVLSDDNSWQTEEDALALLVNQGYQARHRLNGIEEIVAKVRQNKIMDGR